MPDEDNWLNAGRLPCPSCRAPLYRADWSPFIDAYLFCCDMCARRIEVSYYDERFQEIATRSESAHRSLMLAIEPHLSTCTCGGRFRHDAPRRCPHCHAIVLNGAEAVGVDVGPNWDDTDPDSIETAEAIMTGLTRTENPWA